MSAAEICHFVAEIERFLGIDYLLDAQETDLLRQLVTRNPLMRLYREEAAQFLLRLVGSLSFEDFILSRSKLSVRDLTRLVDFHPLKSDSYKSFSSEKATYRNLFTKDFLADRKALDAEPEPIIQNIPDYKGPVEDSTWFQRVKNTTISLLPKSFREKNLNDDQNVTTSYKKYFEPTKRKKEETFEPAQPIYSRNLDSSENTFLQERVRQLELQCERYANELQQCKSSPSERRLQELMRGIEDQDAIIARLEREAHSKNRPAELGVVGSIIDSAFEKTYLQSLRSVKPIVNLTGLILLAVVALNVLKFVYFLFIFVYQNRLTSLLLDDVFEDDVTITFSWVQEISWLEYKIYQFKEWAGY